SCHLTSTSAIYTFSLHDALPICPRRGDQRVGGGDPGIPASCTSSGQRAPPPTLCPALLLGCDGDSRDEIEAGDPARGVAVGEGRSEEQTSELQSRFDLVGRLLLA